MKIALIGYGGMGQALKSAAAARGHAISSIIDRPSGEATAASVSAEALAGADIAIDFSSAEEVLDSTKAALEAGIPLVVGTTGWYDKMDEVRALGTGGGGKKTTGLFGRA